MRIARYVPYFIWKCVKHLWELCACGKGMGGECVIDLLEKRLSKKRAVEMII